MFYGLILVIVLLFLAILAVFLFFKLKSQPKKDDLWQSTLALQNQWHEQLQSAQKNMDQNFMQLVQQFHSAMGQHQQHLHGTLDQLNRNQETRLNTLEKQIEQRLVQGYEKSNETFNGITKRLVLIDEAQKKMDDVSNNVISLQSLLSDKRARGAFGEVQLAALLRDQLPEAAFSLQHTLSNGMRVDCLLKLPQPTGSLAIDSKFPLENYQISMNLSASENERNKAITAFKQDVRKHILDIHNKYIIPGETADGALLFIPAEAIFAEIHNHYPDLVEMAHRSHVWLTSPSTLMAILTTVRAVFKDIATQQQVHVIKQHIQALSQDVHRFQQRMGQLTKHIHQAAQDADEVNISAEKICQKFNKIEKVELDPLTIAPQD
ncbi:MAG: DNA recombination protein RmuC [Pseudomonadota bacterium]